MWKSFLLTSASLGFLADAGSLSKMPVAVGAAGGMLAYAVYVLHV